jgi:hypothetical protein
MMLRRTDSESNHFEHLTLMQQLQELDGALAGLVCHSEVYADLSTAETICRCGRELRETVPSHFAHEEHAVLEAVALLGPQWAAFAREMKGQHLQLQGKLDAFCEAVERLRTGEDLEQSISQLKQSGEEFAGRMLSHMVAEERKLNTITVNA